MDAENRLKRITGLLMTDPGKAAGEVESLGKDLIRLAEALRRPRFKDETVSPLAMNEVIRAQVWGPDGQLKKETETRS